MVQLTKLRLGGFKSFVDSTELLIEPGITGVVGPNGCGKSNLVEALRWVMGETSAKRMRGGEMDDVIFAGSATRPARNLAEVTLALDNSSRNAPAQFNDHDELEVVRRIDRGSGSTYRVNGVEVRARDVQLLFADSATGAHSPALVSQGRVGALINAKPTDRRNLLEEAAGITGLHSRRHEAELRLRAAETNLERLDDVIATLEVQFNGLKKQVRQATRYKNVAKHIRRNEAIVLHLEAEAAKQALAEARESLSEASRAVALLTQSSAARSTEQAEAAAALPALRQAEADAAATLQRLLVGRDNLDREEAQAAAAKDQAEEHLSQLIRDRTRAQALLEDAAAAQTSLDEECAGIDEAAAGEVEAAGAADIARASAAEAVAKLEEETGELSGRIASGEAQARVLNQRVAELSGRLERLKLQAAEVTRQRDALMENAADGNELANATTELATAEAALEGARAQAMAAEQTLSEARAEESEARETLQRTEATHAKLEAEAAALTATLAPSEADLGPPMIDKVTVTSGYEAALGAALGDEITAPDNDAAPVRWQTLPPYDMPSALPAGVESLTQFVHGPAALDRCLSQIGIVPDVATGARLQPQLTPGQRLVTRDGALWRWDGFTAQADAPTSAAARLKQRNRLADLHGELNSAEETLNKARAVFQDVQTRLAEKIAKERDARNVVDRAFDAVNGARRQHAELAQKAAAADSRLSALNDTGERLTGDIDESESALSLAQGEIEALPELDGARLALTALRTKLAEQRQELSLRQSAVDRLARDAEARAQRRTAIQEEKSSWSRRSEEAERHAGELEERQATLRQEIESLAERPIALSQKREALAEHIEAAEQRRKEAADALAVAESRLAEADRALRTEEQKLGMAREERVRAEARVQQSEQTMATVAEKVRDRLECALESVLEAAEVDPGQDLPPRDEVEAKLARLIRERDSIGPVNLRAETEAEELNQQITGMQSERADLVAAIGRLRQGISSLNREARERLLTAFETVNSRFSELFVRLFGGGRAHLKLTDADDPLEAGLEIMASPPGKRLQIMSLLSGGEQALTALSLLFAVFLTNPAPICVLDEVDAPLDDANVDRFCSLVEELTRTTSTRFLVITHHRMTMARVDRLFGVTMSERGVSQLVSVDLSAAESLRESA